MSRLLGPLSETISYVSARVCALAGEKTAGAVTAVLAATAVIDLRNSRRFMATSRNYPWEIIRKGRAKSRRDAQNMQFVDSAGGFDNSRGEACTAGPGELHTIREKSLSVRQVKIRLWRLCQKLQF